MIQLQHPRLSFEQKLSSQLASCSSQFSVALWKPNSSLTPGFNVGLPHGHNIVSRSRLQFAQAFVQLPGCGEVLHAVCDRKELEFESCLTENSASLFKFASHEKM